MVLELEQNFQKAVEDVRSINRTPSQETLLILYSLYKQSIKGDATGKTPYLKGPVAVAKHGAWAALKGTLEEDAMQSYVNLVRDLQSADVPASFDDKHALAKELLQKTISQEEYDEIKELWKKHSLAEDNRDIDGLISTLSEDCVYEIPQKNKIWRGHSGAIEFYNHLLGAFPDVDFRLTNIVIGPQGVVEEARVVGPHEKDWLGYPASGDKIEFQVAIFFPWDADTRKFKGERIYFHFDESYYQKYNINP